ncbi:MAG: hypothetical protein ACRED8_09375 [Caulobacteraceae bacterium]
MSRNMRLVGILTAVAVVFAAAVGASAATDVISVTPVIEQKIVRAVETEIYQRGDEGYFGDIGVPAGPGLHRLAIFIRPTINNREGWVIYKFMPFGQIIRMYVLDSKGGVTLHGDPTNGFPPTQPDYMTVYMDSDQLCRLEHEWIRANFVIDTKSSRKRTPTDSAARTGQ